MARMGKRERERKRRQRQAEVERDAAMLPTYGPIADLVLRIGKELDRCIVAGRASFKAVEFLHLLGLEAFSLVGSIRGLRAVAVKASNREPGPPEARVRLIDTAWDGIGDDRGMWTARGVR